MIRDPTGLLLQDFLSLSRKEARCFFSRSLPLLAAERWLPADRSFRTRSERARSDLVDLTPWRRIEAKEACGTSLEMKLLAITVNIKVEAMGDGKDGCDGA